ncbi:CLUMA_CG008495, isoform A [Clunio marinus]|uniref:CLUMA_CG008495, isoform A n=1 Tax=Clunio marinus TaxID=568069 RepID=A0A1J1I9A2_9DIPT|nr:CLUMA_CG008495, isoform A [Clunio marinus]
MTTKNTPVYVYYESLCPDSQAFITKQLYPAMKMLKDHVDLHLIPFGKSTYQTRGADTTFECHHGPNECYGNKIQACAINHIQVDSFQQENTRETLIVEYINCLMKNDYKDVVYPSLARNCSTQVQVKNFDSIQTCANSTEGSKYLEQMGEMTLKLQNPLKSVPTITIKESYDDKIQNLALTDFSSAVCQNLPKPIPAVCRAYSSATSISGSIVLGVLSLVASLSLMM